MEVNKKKKNKSSDLACKKMEENYQNQINESIEIITIDFKRLKANFIKEYNLL